MTIKTSTLSMEFWITLGALGLLFWPLRCPTVTEAVVVESMRLSAGLAAVFCVCRTALKWRK